LRFSLYFGYAGLKKGLHEMARRHVDEAMAEKLKEYPSHAEIMETLQAQMIASPVTNVIQTASNTVRATGEQIRAESNPVSIEQYPGEEPTDVSDKKHD
jgi:hypothetical protein